MPATTVKPPKHEREPIYWFAKLEMAVLRRDNQTAREALSRLEKLGIEVRYLIPPVSCGSVEVGNAS